MSLSTTINPTNTSIDAPAEIEAFLLTRHWRDSKHGLSVELWCASPRGPLRIDVSAQEAVFFLARDNLASAHNILPSNACRIGNANFKNHAGAELLPVYFKHFRAAREAAESLRGQGIPVWESDIKPPERFLMERFITGALVVSGQAIGKKGFLHFKNPRLKTSETRPSLRIVSLDIETSLDARQLYSIAVYGERVRKVFMVGAVSEISDDLEIIGCATERDCLSDFLAWLREFDPDIVIGWNVVQFDLWVLEQRCAALGLAFEIGRDEQKGHWREDEENNRRYLQIPGRVALDGIDLIKAANYSFTSYSLENVARSVLGEGKLLASSNRGREIAELFQQDKVQLARYNLKDCELVWDIFRETKLMEFAIERAQLTGLALDRAGGSVAAFEYAYLPRLHRKGYVAPNLGELKSKMLSPGGYVLDSRPGIFRNVLVLDFKSLYPSIIRTFRIDPYAFWYAEHQQLPKDERVPGFKGASFAKDEHLLPGIIETLWQARDRAKAEHNQPLSHAIKIIMNSFYGVLGSTGCRFYDPRVCSSITLRGHEIIQQSKAWIEDEGHEVIYGDTDSLFVWIGDDPDEKEALAIGRGLATSLNVQWQRHLMEKFSIESALEIEFETHYLKFLMPTIRNSELGSKKRYAGVVRKKGELQLAFKGLENVRTDWTALAKQFQEELYQKVFDGEPVEDYVRETVEAVRQGLRDRDLVYRKRLRRKLADYEKNVPPHVQAARKQQLWSGTTIYRGDYINYLITLNGPEPEQGLQSPIDYQHYIDRQLAPVADGVLRFIGLNFKDIIAPQLNLFGLE